MNGIIGIDLGNEFCRTGIYRDGEFELIPNPYANRRLNDFKRPDKNFDHIYSLVGIKHFIGYDFQDKKSTQTINEKTYEIFSKIINFANEYLYTDIEGAVLTVPSYYMDKQRLVIKTIAENSGFRNISLLDENISAILGMRLEKKKATILVYSLGTGSFTTSVIKCENDTVNVINSESEKKLLGNYFNSLISKIILDKISVDITFVDDSKHRNKFYSELFKVSSYAKIELSLKEETQVSFKTEGLIKSQGNEVNKSVNFILTRKEFEEKSHNYVKETIDICNKTIHDSKISMDDIDHVLLVGGTTKIPIIERKLEEEFGKKIIHAPEDAIVRGAAKFAFKLPKPSGNEDMKKFQQKQSSCDKPSIQTKKVTEKQTSDWNELFSNEMHNAHKLWKKGEYVNSLESIESVYNNIKKYISHLYHTAGKKSLDKGNKEEAKTHFLKGLKYDMDNSSIKTELHIIYEKKAEQIIKNKNYQFAITVLKKALEYKPKCSKCSKYLTELKNIDPTGKRKKKK